MLKFPKVIEKKLGDTFSFIEFTKTCNLFNTPSCLTHINTIILTSVFIGVQLIIPILKDMFLKQSFWSMICLYQGSVVKLVHHIYSSYSKQISHIKIYNHTSQWWMPILLFNYFVVCWYSLGWPVYTKNHFLIARATWQTLSLITTGIIKVVFIVGSTKQLIQIRSAQYSAVVNIASFNTYHNC